MTADNEKKRVSMRTIAIEEHFLSRGFREVLQRNASNEGGRGQPMPRMTAERQARLADLDALRLQDMDKAGIDLQVISENGPVVAPQSGEEEVKLARESNDQLAGAIAAHPDRFAGFATLPMTEPEVAADELERAVRSLGLRGAMIHGTSQGRFLDDPGFPARSGTGRRTLRADLYSSCFPACTGARGLL